MKEGAYYDLLRQQLLEDYLYIKSFTDNKRLQDVAVHIGKAEVAIDILQRQVLILERKTNGSH